MDCIRGWEQKFHIHFFIDMNVDVVKELLCLCYGVFAKSAPAHEGTEKCDKCSYKQSSWKKLKDHNERTH